MRRLVRTTINLCCSDRTWTGFRSPDEARTSDLVSSIGDAHVAQETPLQLTGIHHLTAVSADAPGNKAFYTGTLGMRLVKKTVNQDDVSAYHLFYADGIAAPGTDVTFFDWPWAAPNRAGVPEIGPIGLRVAGDDALDYWEARLTDLEVPNNRKDVRLAFTDPEGLRFELVPDAG